MVIRSNSKRTSKNRAYRQANFNKVFSAKDEQLPNINNNFEKEFIINKNNGKGKDELLEDMNNRIEVFDDILEASQIMDDDEIDELLMKICTYFNITIICYITGLRIKSFKKDKTTGKEIPVFSPWNRKIFDCIKSTSEVGILSKIAAKVQALAYAINETDLTADKQIFKKKEWFNLQTIGRITKEKALLISCTIISPESIGDLKDVRDHAWKEFLVGAGIAFLLMLSAGCCIAYNTNENFKRNCDDLFNYYSDIWNNDSVTNINGDDSCVSLY